MVLTQKIDQFVGKIRLGVEFFEEAGALLVDMLNENPQVFDDIIRETGENWLTHDVLSTFEMIGRKKLAVSAIFMPRHVLEKIISMPIRDQERIVRNPVPVVMGVRRGSRVTLHKRAVDLTRREAARAIGKSGTRSPEEQEALLRVKYSKKRQRLVGRYTLIVPKGRPYHSPEPAYLKPSSSEHPEALQIEIPPIRELEIALFVRQ